jgi:hypothetical protein
LPPAAATNSFDGRPWGDVEELLALIFEEVSLSVSNKQRKEPVRIPRPGVTVTGAAPEHVAKHGGRVVGARNMIALARLKGVVRG